jgi:hypothetical protein
MLEYDHSLSQDDILKDGYDRFLQLPVRISDLIFTVKEMLST